MGRPRPAFRFQPSARTFAIGNFTGILVEEGIARVAGWRRSDPGGYDLLFDFAGQGMGTYLATFGPTLAATGWEPFDVEFTAPADASTRPQLIFDAVGIRRLLPAER